MPLDDAEFEELAKSNCPHCVKTLKVRRRTDTGEWVHDTDKMHAICWSNSMRVARYNSKAPNG